MATQWRACDENDGCCRVHASAGGERGFKLVLRLPWLHDLSMRLAKQAPSLTVHGVNAGVENARTHSEHTDVAFPSPFRTLRHELASMIIDDQQLERQKKNLR